LTYFVIFVYLVYAQRIDKQQIFIAVSEEEVYKLYEQMLDSARVSNRFLQPGPMADRFGFGLFEGIDSKDTLMRFEQECSERFHGDYICDRTYWPYISNCMPISFYERFLNYLKKFDKIENFYIKDYITGQLGAIMYVIIKQYESGKLNKNDSLKAQQLIEGTLWRMIEDDHNYRVLLSSDKYITDKIRQALVNVIENPFYPAEYLDFYMSQQDTASLDTTGIPPNLTVRWKVQFTPEELQAYERDLPLYERLRNFRIYEEIGREEYNGLSAGQAYLQRKRDNFREKGYLPINEIAEYAYQKQDELLIKHLKAFKKKHPDYPLKYF
jgi:hypothetical protein